MEHLTMHTPNMVDENIRKIGELFPNCITETKDENGKVVPAIDFDLLRQELSHEIVEGYEERYRFEWPDKRNAILNANSPTTATLRPCRSDSVDFDHTQNLYIEGDNLEVLKLLRETYLGKVKMIYIDPPYNTGNDFVYEDDFAQSTDEYMAGSGQFDEEQNRMVANTESNGRFHTDWLNMIYPRLKIAKDFLTEDGSIFISIDDNEQYNLKKVCDEIFGANNFVATIVWQRTYAPISLKKHFSESHEYCFVYSKSIEKFKMNLLPRSDKQNKDYKNPDNDSRGPWKVGNCTVGPAIEKQIYPIIGPTGKTFLPPSGYCWRFTKERFEELRKDNRIWFGPKGDGSPTPKLFLSEVQNGITPMTLWTFDEVGHSQEATRELRELLDYSVFTSPKPLRYIRQNLIIGTEKESLIMDFFSGSATTAHAVMQLNAEDGGSRRFIMVQLPELTDEKSEAYKAGYLNICEIGKERIRRAGKKIKEDNKDKPGIDRLDTGFRVLKLDSSNMEDVFYTPDKFDASKLFIDNVKQNRTPEDLLFQVMLMLGIELSATIVERTIGGKKVFSVMNDFLIACFDTDIDESVITDIAKLKPIHFVMRDSSMTSDNVADNFEQIFRTHSNGTNRFIL